MLGLIRRYSPSSQQAVPLPGRDTQLTLFHLGRTGSRE